MKQLIIVLVNAYTDNCADRDTARFLRMYVIIFIIKKNYYYIIILVESFCKTQPRQRYCNNR